MEKRMLDSSDSDSSLDGSLQKFLLSQGVQISPNKHKTHQHLHSHSHLSPIHDITSNPSHNMEKNNRFNSSTTSNTSNNNNENIILNDSSMQIEFSDKNLFNSSFRINTVKNNETIKINHNKSLLSGVTVMNRNENISPFETISESISDAHSETYFEAKTHHSHMNYSQETSPSFGPDHYQSFSQDLSSDLSEALKILDEKTAFKSKNNKRLFENSTNHSTGIAISIQNGSSHANIDNTDGDKIDENNDVDVDSIDELMHESILSYPMSSNRNEEEILTSHQENIESLLPSCIRLNQILSKEGYFPMHFALSDVQLEKRVMSTFVIEAWAETIITAFSELNDRLNTYKTATKDTIASLSRNYSNTTSDAMNYRLSELQIQFNELEKKEKLQSKKMFELEETIVSLRKKIKTDEVTTKKTVKAMELQLQESERRCRQKEVEVDRLKEKLSTFVEKQRNQTIKQQAILSAHRSTMTGNNISDNLSNNFAPDISFISTNHAGSSKKPIISPVKISPKSNKKEKKPMSFSSSLPSSQIMNSNNVNGGGSSSNSSNNINHNIIPSNIGPGMLSDLVKALENENIQLYEHQHDLEREIRDLTRTLKDVTNSVLPHINSNTNPSNPKEAIPQQNSQTNLSDTSDMNRSDATDTNRSDTISPSPNYSSNHHGNSNPTIKSLYEKITSLSNIVLELQDQNDVLKGELSLSQNILDSTETQLKIVLETNQNLEIELDSRPSIKQYSHQKQIIEELQAKLSDLLLHRANSLEMDKLQQHMTVKQRIAMDKRNYELGLHYIDLLPQKELTEIVKNICRELDLQQVADLIPSITKLKAVVKAIPYLEKFIKQLCQFLYDTENSYVNHGERRLLSMNESFDFSTKRVTMDDVLPILKRWRSELVDYSSIKTFYDQITSELYRHYSILFDTSTLSSHEKRGTTNLLSKEEWIGSHGNKSQCFATIQSLVNLDINLISTKINLSDVAATKSSGNNHNNNHDILISRLIEHIQYLFHIPTITQILPTLKDVYQKQEDMNAFLNDIRNMLRFEQSAKDSILLNETLRIVKECKSQ